MLEPYAVRLSVEAKAFELQDLHSLEALLDRLTTGRAAFEMDGSMVDIPVVRRAEQVLQRYEAVNARARHAC